MKLLLGLLLALPSAFVPWSPARIIRLGDLQPNQRVEVDWQYQGCFSSGRYKLTFSSTGQRLQVEIKQIGLASDAEMQTAIIPVTRKNLSEWDEALASYPYADSSNLPTCTGKEQVIVTLYEDGAERAQEVLENKNCSPTKIWSFIESLKKKSNLNWSAVSTVIERALPRNN